MKDPLAPMNLADITLLLGAAARLSNHRHFVIAGSLSAVGAVLEAPAEMVMSRDVDIYPKFDPERGFIEIASHLAEGTEFARAHGFFADPITPGLLTLPDGWEARLLQLPLAGGVVGWFLDPNDAAVSKLVRGADNDVRWVRAGIAAGIVQPAVARERIGRSSASAEEAQTARAALARSTGEGAIPVVQSRP